jgi:hypothetical protein
MLLGLAFAQEEPVGVQPTPDGFDKYLVYMAAGVFDPEAEGPGPEIWHREIMQRSDEEIAENQAQAEAFFMERFGLDFSEVEAVDGVKEIEGVTLRDFMLDPNREYRAYTISDEAVPSEGWVVRDGGWMVNFENEITLQGNWGGPDGTVVPAGSFVVFGEYNIDVPGGEPIIIHYESGSPISPTEEGTMMFICDLSHPEWGEGLAQGIVNTEELEDGRSHESIRNILTFPGRGRLGE